MQKCFQNVHCSVAIVPVGPWIPSRMCPKAAMKLHSSAQLLAITYVDRRSEERCATFLNASCAQCISDLLPTVELFYACALSPHQWCTLQSVDRLGGLVTAQEATAYKSLAHASARAGRGGASLRGRMRRALGCRRALQQISKPASRSAVDLPSDHRR